MPTPIEIAEEAKADPKRIYGTAWATGNNAAIVEAINDTQGPGAGLVDRTSVSVADFVFTFAGNMFGVFVRPAATQKKWDRVISMLAAVASSDTYGPHFYSQRKCRRFAGTNPFTITGWWRSSISQNKELITICYTATDLAAVYVNLDGSTNEFGLGFDYWISEVTKTDMFDGAWHFFGVRWWGPLSRTDSDVFLDGIWSNWTAGLNGARNGVDGSQIVVGGQHFARNFSGHYRGAWNDFRVYSAVLPRCYVEQIYELGQGGAWELKPLPMPLAEATGGWVGRSYPRGVAAGAA